MAALIGTLSVAQSVSGCRQAPPAPVSKVVAAEPGALQRARTAMDGRDYGSAVPLLREVLAQDPADREAHYRLAVSASHLDQTKEASREFEWVVANGAAGAQEVQIARDWLASRTRPSAPAPRVLSSTAANPEMATLAGRAIGPEGAKPRFQLFLKGLPGSPVADEYHVIRTDQHGSFQFADVVPGDYMLTTAIAGPPTWRLRVSVANGQRLVLDLSPANLATIRDDFPGLRP